MNNNDELRKMMYDFIQTLEKLNKRNENIHQYGKVVMSLLSSLKIKEGYELDFYCCGEDLESWRHDRYVPYICGVNATDPYQPTVYKDGTPVAHEERFRRPKKNFFGIDREKRRQRHVPYDTSKRVVDKLAPGEYEDIPPIMPYFEEPFTEEGILQAWLLDNIHLFLPLFGHSINASSTFILNEEEIYSRESISDDEDLEIAMDAMANLDRNSLYPSVVIEGDDALIKVTYWNHMSGLVRKQIKALKYRNYIKFDEPVTEVLVPYNSEIRFF